MSESTPTGGIPPQEQEPPGRIAAMDPRPDHGERDYRGHDRLRSRRALITGGDSGIGRAVAIAFAREGADVAIAHLPSEAEDAASTIELVRAAGVRGESFAADLREPEAPARLVEDAVDFLGGLDLLVLNAGAQRDVPSFAELSTESLDRTFRTNLYGTVLTARAAVDRLPRGASILVTASIQAFDPSPGLIDYAMTKAALVAFVEALAEELGPKGIRVNAVAPGPIWTPLIPATSWDAERIASFGKNTPFGRPGQPAELAGAYVHLASDEASYTSGAVLAVTGGRHL